MKRVYNEYEGKKGVHLDYFARMKLGAKLLNLSDKIKKLLNEENQGAVNSHFDSLATQRTVLQLINQIRENKYPKIGIFGPHGVGKTRVMQFLKHSPEVTTRFDFVIWVTVSNSQSIKKLQEQVQQCLSMKITSCESDEKVAEKIFQALLGKKYLLFLDDVRNAVDLGDLGFPNANTENGCQVVFTTTTLSKCWYMETDIDIEVKGFAPEEAWDMFHSLAGNVAVYPSIEHVAKEIVNMCSGLPRSLQLVAGTIRKEEILDELAGTARKERNLEEKYLDKWGKFLEDLSNAVNSHVDPIVFCFRKLEKIKSVCLMYCAFYPDHHKIKKSRIINYMRACEYLIPYEHSSAETHVDGDMIFDDLVKSSWLEICDGGGHVTMPVIIRDLLKEEPLFKQSVSSNLPTNENFMPVSLVLQGTGQLEPIPESAFKYMHKLQNLDLSGTNIKSLPDAITNMKRLHALFLKDCYFLETLPDKLGEVTTLEILQVSGAWMPNLPLLIFNLQSLKILKFGYRSIARWWSAPYHYGIGQKECEIPSGSVSKLTEIEVFNVSNFMYNSRLSNGSLSNIAQELGSLQHLSSLHFVFLTIEDFEHFLRRRTIWLRFVLKKFRFVVGKGKDFHIDIKRHKQCLKYNGGKGSNKSILPEAVLTVLAKSRFFELEKHEQIKCLSELGKEDTREVRHCGIYGCANLESVINRDDLVANIFENLESLTLSNLPKFSGFESFWDFGNPDSYTFANLRDVELKFCTTVREIFKTNQVVRKLNKLEELRIKSCPKLYRVISMDVSVWHWDLPRLKKVTLEDLPELQCILSDDLPHWDSLEEVCIIDCPRLEMLPFNTSNAKKLKKIKGSQKWWATALIWDEENKQPRKITESRFKSLFMEA